MKAVQIAKSIEQWGLNGAFRILSIAKNALGSAKEGVQVRHDKAPTRELSSMIASAIAPAPLQQKRWAGT